MSTISQLSIAARRHQFIVSWREFAPEESFAGSTLAQFEAQSQEPEEVRQRLFLAKTQLAAIILERQQADDRLWNQLILLAHGVRANPSYGEDCPFYRSLGFIPKSERKPSIRRNPKPAVATATPPASNVA